MIRYAAILAFAALTACSSGVSPTAGTGVATAVGVATANVPAIRAACAAAAPVLAAGQANSSPVAKDVASYGTAFCLPVSQGMMPATADANSAAWVAGLVGQLAPLLIPLI